jgi:hypothetical protein
MKNTDKIEWKNVEVVMDGIKIDVKPMKYYVKFPRKIKKRLKKEGRLF